jgi:hypothetical protein
MFEAVVNEATEYQEIDNQEIEVEKWKMN